MHKKGLIGGIALLALSAVGGGLATASPERDVLVPAEPTMIDFVDPATVGGLVARTMVEDHGGRARRHVHITYPELRDAPRLNKALRDEAERTLRDFRDLTRFDAPRPRPELNVDWQLAAASGDIVGVRLRTGESLGTGWGNSTRTLWYDRRTGKATGSAGLLAGQSAMRDLTRLVKERLAKRGSPMDLGRVRGDQLDSMAFNQSGDLVVEFDDCQVGPCSLGRLAVAVPARQADPLLSPTGRRAQEAVREAARQASPTTPRTLPSPSPEAVSNQAGSVDCTKAKCIALTFADGPGPNTPRLLDTLRRAGARATFFVVGTNAATRPDLLARMSTEGHLVANHTWAHLDLSKLPTSKIADSLRRTQDTITAAIGERPTLMRPPYGAMNQDVLDVAQEMGLAVVGQNVDAGDLRAKDAKAIADRVTAQAGAGAIVLLHDVRAATVDAVPDILKKLRGKGYTLVTVPELYGTAGMQAGRLYRSGSEIARHRPLT
ncbi:polysaccharide deacetylase family protein [Nonomuraea guangzhouensis]|uniref:Polysaccharide deacetylase family protein n=1 Tax=Nonomuraea guangzhouensis TaxID=1291555 RepID=A0ABW4GQ46_9ACTN|nr:polysaccharide deacetylase family protein [Nonomuraea guangzhouensis]